MATHKTDHSRWRHAKLTTCHKPRDKDYSFQKGSSKRIEAFAKAWIQNRAENRTGTVNQQESFYFPPGYGLHILLGHVVFLKMEAQTCEEEEREECVWRGLEGGGGLGGVGVWLEKKERRRAGGQAGQWHSRVTTWRHWQGVFPTARPSCYHSRPPFPGRNPQRHRHYWVAAWCHNPTPVWAGDAIVRQWSVALRYWTHTHSQAHTQAHWSALATSLATICPALPCSGLGTASNGHALTRLS